MSVQVRHRVAEHITALRTDLKHAHWEKRNAALLDKHEADLGARLLVSER